MTKAYTDLFYFPNIQNIASFYHHDIIYLEVNDNYQKRTWRNKTQLAGPDGPVVLSVPLLKGKHQGQRMKDVRIDNAQAWQRIHWRTLSTLYGKSPYFMHYAYLFEPIFHREYTHLATLNMDAISILQSILHWPATIQMTSHIADGSAESDINLRGTNPYPVTGKAAAGCPPYPQVFEDRQGFIANCSILDLIFCCGPEATLRMRDVNPELCS
ncbi:MAG: WbqC family protein [Saprospiraceae bacterium]|nr:WbqC family protein [Saprospiraceae bacterium]MCB9318642.1 WbqC family protein [Lewinellaceae bacterium]